MWNLAPGNFKRLYNAEVFKRNHKIDPDFDLKLNIQTEFCAFA